MGSKEKFWWRDQAGRHQLFKRSRAGTGEHWSEKVASELGALLDLPCARVELATWQDTPGCIVESFLHGRSVPLVHGNELLQELDETYPVLQFHGVSKHCVSTVLGALEFAGPPSVANGEPQLSTGADWFVGYLLLDALILNTDRHHENWAVLQRPDGRRELAPTYDHASCLGRELTDLERSARIAGRDRGRSVEDYVRKARSALYLEPSAQKPAHPMHAFAAAAASRPAAYAHFRRRLAKAVTPHAVLAILERVPDSMVSGVGREFARQLLELTLASLLAEAP